MYEPNPYNAAFSRTWGNPTVKPFVRLIVLLALMPQVGAIAQTSSTDEVRERLQAFGQVCRGTNLCPAPRSKPAATDGAPHWQAVGSSATGEGPSGGKSAQSRWVATDIGWPETAASIAVASDRSASMRFTHLDLDKGQISRYGPWEDHWITLGAGEREQAFAVRKPADGQNILLLGRGPGNFIARVLEDGTGGTLLVAMHYRGHGRVVFPFPLSGAADLFHRIGLIAERPAETQADGMASDAAVATAEIPVPAPERSGEEIYNTFCFACHATAVAEAPLFGSLEQWQPRIDKGMDTLVATSLAGFDLMPPMGTCVNCTEDEMRGTIQYMIDNAR